MPLGNLQHSPVRRSPRLNTDNTTNSSAHSTETNREIGSDEGSSSARQVEQNEAHTEEQIGVPNSQALQEGSANNVNSAEAQNIIIAVLQKQIASLEGELKKLHSKVRENESQNSQLKLALENHTKSAPVTAGNQQQFSVATVSSNQIPTASVSTTYATSLSSAAPSVVSTAATDASAFSRATHNAMHAFYSAAPTSTVLASTSSSAMQAASVPGAIVFGNLAGDSHNAMPGATSASATFANIAGESYHAMPGATVASATFANLAGESYYAMPGATVASANTGTFANHAGAPYRVAPEQSAAFANLAGHSYNAMTNAAVANSAAINASSSVAVATTANCAAPFASSVHSANANANVVTATSAAAPITSAHFAANVASFSAAPFAATAGNVAPPFHVAAPCAAPPIAASTTVAGAPRAPSIESIYGVMPFASRSSAAADFVISRAGGYNAIPAGTNLYGHANAAMGRPISGYSASLASTPATSSYSTMNNALPSTFANRPVSAPSSVIFPRKLQDLPEFSGLAEDWPLFINAFIESTNAYGYSKLENNQRLQKCLKGEARETVKSLLIHPDNIDAIIEQLRFRFGRPEQLIQSQLSMVKEISSISESGVAKLIPFATKVKNLSAFLQSAGGHHHLANPTLTSELINKLPMSKRIEWARYSSLIQPYPTVVHFSDWLSEIANLICKVQEQEQRDPKRRVVLHTAEEQPVYASKCVMCPDHHKLQECKRFLNATVEDRWKLVKSQRLCFACLAKGHSSRECRRRKTCLSNGCKKSHNKLLHDYTPVHRHKEKSVSDIQVSRNSNSDPVLSCVANAKSSKLLFRILPVTLYNNSKTVDTYALFDEGSSVTMVDSSIVEELGLKGEERNLNVQWFGGHKAEQPAAAVSILISGRGMKKKHTLRNVYSVRNLNLPCQSLNETDIRQRTAHQRLLPLLPYNGATPKLLIGLDHCRLGIPSETMRISINGPYAAHTELGWTVFGPSTAQLVESSTNLFVGHTLEQTIDVMIADYFSTEGFGVKSSPPVEGAADVRARTLLASTTRLVEGHYETGLLWERDDVHLPESYTAAYKRLLGIERRMQKDSLFSQAYKDIMSSYVNKNYARKLTPDEAALSCPKTWYLPHFGVTNPNKPGKLRLVFDAAAESHGVSLNSLLLKGPQEYQPLPSVLFHFREGAVAVCGDIKEMFHQVRIREEDRCSQRFLWRDGDTSKQPDIFEMRVMTFGAACSPCAAQYVKSLNALEHQAEFPRAVKSILERHYVDDFVDSFDNIKEAIDVAKKVCDIHKLAGFELRRFTSNSQEVLEALNGTEVAMPILNKEGLAVEKILGMVWQPLLDCFTFRLRFHNVDEAIITGQRRPTKRELLSIVMSIFDPLGFLNNLTITAKLLMREIWRRKIKWDEPLSDDLNDAWRSWQQQLSSTCSLRIPRHYFRGEKAMEVQLHIFVDASEQAFAAAAYWRTRSSTGEISVALVCSKSRCAPLKPLTVPRLELQAAVLGTRLMQTVRNEHEVIISNCVLWSDSTTVLSWISSVHRRYKPFVAHRVAEILAATKPSSWRWVPTAHNVADEATRAKRVCNELESCWLSGPQFLQMEEEHWPKAAEIKECDVPDEEELRQKYALAIVSNEFIDFNRFSTFGRLIRTMAWVTRFVGRCRNGKQPDEAYGLTFWELETAKCVLYRHVQAQVFAAEIRLLEKDAAIPRTSVIYQLSPYLDEHRILRLKGRIDAAEWLPVSTRRPIILPPNHQFTKLLVSQHHVAMKHQNTEATICEIRQKYWIPRLRKLLRTVISNCQVCRVAKATPAVPPMGPLPIDRLTPYVRPFSYTGLDYFGPINVAIGRRREKRWVALFTCLTIRAVHLELAHDLSTDACIVAIRNFINRRGVPVRMRSDNGKNFVGANQEAKRFSEVFDCDRLQGEMSGKGVEWWFNCPINPSEGGVWERMVQCVKRVLRKTLKEICPQENTLICFLIEAENVVNSRPLTHLPISPDQEEPLTPNHFLLGTANTAQTPASSRGPERLCALRKQWRIARHLRDHFWKRWIAEYLPTLTRRAKWCDAVRSLKIGDVVFICDDSLPRSHWCRGIVDKVYPGVDGVVRQVDVRTSKGTLRRAASKLALLDVEVGESC